MPLVTHQDAHGLLLPDEQVAVTAAQMAPTPAFCDVGTLAMKPDATLKKLAPTHGAEPHTFGKVLLHAVVVHAEELAVRKDVFLLLPETEE